MPIYTPLRIRISPSSRNPNKKKDPFLRRRRTCPARAGQRPLHPAARLSQHRRATCPGRAPTSPQSRRPARARGEPASSSDRATPLRRAPLLLPRRRATAACIAGAPPPPRSGRRPPTGCRLLAASPARSGRGSAGSGDPDLPGLFPELRRAPGPLRRNSGEQLQCFRRTP